MVTNCASYLNNNLMYMGGAGLYAPTFQYERNPQVRITCACACAAFDGATETRPRARRYNCSRRLRRSRASLRVHAGGRCPASPPPRFPASPPPRPNRPVLSGATARRAPSPTPRAQCVVCGEGVVLEATPTMSFTHLMDAMADDARLRLKAPSVSTEGGKKGNTLYMRGPLEPHYKGNLDLPISELFDSGATLTITDPGVPTAIKVVVNYDQVTDVTVA